MPAAAYGGVLLMCGARVHDPGRARSSRLLEGTRRSRRRSAVMSRAGCRWRSTAAAHPVRVRRSAAFRTLIYVAVALMWLMPDRRIEHELHDGGRAGASADPLARLAWAVLA